MTDKRFLNAREVADIMGISVSTAYKIIRNLNDELKSIDEYGFTEPAQTRALKNMGFEPPDTSQKEGRYNNVKQTFTRDQRLTIIRYIENSCPGMEIKRTKFDLDPANVPASKKIAISQNDAVLNKQYDVIKMQNDIISENAELIHTKAEEFDALRERAEKYVNLEDVKKKIDEKINENDIKEELNFIADVLLRIFERSFYQEKNEEIKKKFRQFIKTAKLQAYDTILEKRRLNAERKYREIQNAVEEYFS